MHFARLVLLNTLKKELRYERSILKMPEYLTEFIRKHQLVEHSDVRSTNFYLSKQAGVFKIQLEVPFRVPFSEVKPIKYENDGLGFEEEEENPKSFKEDVSKFFVSVQREEDIFLHFECFTYESSIWIQNIVFSNEKPSNLCSLFHLENQDVNYNTLNESVQQSIIDWLKDLGIVEEFAKYLEIRSLYKEKELYINWLQNLSNFLNEA